MSVSSKRRVPHPPASTAQPSRPSLLTSVAVKPPPETKQPEFVDARFGLCPQCRSWAGKFARDDRDGWLACDVHRVRWFATDVGRELRKDGTSFHDIADYAEVDPVWPAQAHPAYSSALRWPRETSEGAAK